MLDKPNGAAAAAKRYFGEAATGYEARRASRPFWAKEHATVESMLSDLPRGSEVLDIPVGTGRYAPIYKKFGFRAVGVDASDDMLAIARDAASKIGLIMNCHRGDALDIMYPDNSFDAVVCTRLVNWFLPPEMASVLRQSMRIARDRVIVSVKLAPRTSDKGNKPHEPATWAGALGLAGAKERQRVEIEPDYWMIHLVHT